MGRRQFVQCGAGQERALPTAWVSEKLHPGIPTNKPAVDAPDSIGWHHAHVAGPSETNASWQGETTGNPGDESWRLMS